jgi:cold shock CspA family protein
MNIKHLKTASKVAAVLSVSLLAGCATTNDDSFVVHDNNLVLSKISESADQIKADLHVLAKVEQYNNAVPFEQFKEPTKGPLAKKITIKWNGPATPVAKMIAKMIGYGFRESGTPDVNIHPVDIDSKGVSAFKVLEDIGLSMGNKAGLLVNEKLKLIQIVHRR